MIVKIVGVHKCTNREVSIASYHVVPQINCSIRHGPLSMKEAKDSTACRKGVKLLFGNWVAISER